MLNWNKKRQQAIHLLPKDAYRISCVTTYPVATVTTTFSLDRSYTKKLLATCIKGPPPTSSSTGHNCWRESREVRSTQHSNSTRTALMLLLTLGASLVLLISAGTTQGCELTAHLYTRQWVELHLHTKLRPNSP